MANAAQTASSELYIFTHIFGFPSWEPLYNKGITLPKNLTFHPTSPILIHTTSQETSYLLSQQNLSIISSVRNCTMVSMVQLNHRKISKDTDLGIVFSEYKFPSDVLFARKALHIDTHVIHIIHRIDLQKESATAHPAGDGAWASPTQIPVPSMQRCYPR